MPGNSRWDPAIAPDPTDGPTGDGEHRDRVSGYIDTGESEGATLVLDGRGLTVDGYEDGFFLGATLFDDVQPDMVVYRDEIFGPVLSIVRVDHYEDAIRLVNENQWGNGTAAGVHQRRRGCAEVPE